MGKEADIKQYVKIVFLHGNVAAIDVDHIRQRLKGKKRDTYRQSDLRNRDRK